MIKKFELYDEILITGTAFSPLRRFEKLYCVISAIDDDAIKVWPFEIIGDCKIWFLVSQIEYIEKVE